VKESRGFPQLETDRLVLREMTLADAEFYFRHFNDEKVVLGSGFPGPETLEAAEKELELYCIRPFKVAKGIRWGIMWKGSSGLIGSCGFYGWSKTSRRAEVGYDLDPAHWGKGLMREALRAALRYGFEVMALNRIQAIIDCENVRSIRLVQRLGFQQEGVLRQNSVFRGEFRDEACFSLLREERMNAGIP